MSELIQGTVTPQGNVVTPVVVTSQEEEATTSQTVQYIVYFFFGILEILLAFRFVLLLTGASASSTFVSMIYAVTRVFILPFQGIFHSGVGQGIETSAVFEPATIIALLAYAVLAWGIVKLVGILSGEKQSAE